MHNFHEKVEGTDPDLLDEFARRRVESKGLNTIVSTPLEKIITENVVKFYHKLPEKSPSRPAFLHVVTKGTKAKLAANHFSLKTRTIKKAQKIRGGRRLQQILRPRITRDRLSPRVAAIKSFFDEIVETPSGQNLKKYFGTPKSMYQEYRAYCLAKGKSHIGFKAFHQIQKSEHVGIFSGDQFSDPLWIIMLEKLQEYS